MDLIAIELNIFLIVPVLKHWNKYLSRQIWYGCIAYSLPHNINQQNEDWQRLMWATKLQEQFISLFNYAWERCSRVHTSTYWNKLSPQTHTLLLCTPCDHTILEEQNDSLHLLDRYIHNTSWKVHHLEKASPCLTRQVLILTESYGVMTCMLPI